MSLRRQYIDIDVDVDDDGDNDGNLGAHCLPSLSGWLPCFLKCLLMLSFKAALE